MRVRRCSQPRSRPVRTLVVMSLSWLLVLTACTTTSSVEVADMPATGSATQSEAPESETTAGNDSESADETGDTGDSADGEPAQDEEPRFALEGELPLATADVNSLIDFIEQETERPFVRPPVIVAQSRADFTAGLTEDLGDFEAESELDIRSLQSLGLTDQGVSAVANAFVDLLASPDGVLGYYDPEVEKVVVPVDAQDSDDFRSLLVHELTHALDAQYADLNILEDLFEEAEISGDYEPIVTLQAVVEGRATSVQNRWMAANGVRETLPDDSAAFEAVPPAMLLSLSLPYVFGELYIQSEGGASGTWDLLEDPPDSSEEFLVPGSAGEEIVTVPVPPADGPALRDSVYGASDLFVWMLGESLEPDPLLIFPTLNAVDGWAGGRSVVWGDDTETCTRISFAADSPNDLAEIQELLEDWASRGEGRSVTADADLVTVTGCAPYLP